MPMEKQPTTARSASQKWVCSTCYKVVYVPNRTESVLVRRCKCGDNRFGPGAGSVRADTCLMPKET